MHERKKESSVPGVNNSTKLLVAGTVLLADRFTMDTLNLELTDRLFGQ